eukprot:13764575-Alexandrium_andersonii.AAC.1
MTHFVIWAPCPMLAQEQAVRHGFTKYGLDNLKRQRVIFIKGTPKSFGGDQAVTPGLICKCLARLQGWARLAVGAVRAEFPDFEVQASWSVFGVTQRGQERQRDEDTGSGSNGVWEVLRWCRRL